MSEAESLIEYLATHDAPCPGCGYNLRGLKANECPECARTFLLQELIESQRRRSPFWANILSVVMALPFAILATLAVALAIDYDISTTWPAMSVFVFICAILCALFLFPVRRILKQKLVWVLVLNPISLVIMLYLVTLALVLLI